MQLYKIFQPTIFYKLPWSNKRGTNETNMSIRRFLWTVDDTRLCFPDLSIEPHDLKKAAELVEKLKDKDFYEECSKNAIKKYGECFEEKVYIYTIKRIIKEVISND